jgi:hypothetical protein
MDRGCRQLAWDRWAASIYLGALTIPQPPSSPNFGRGRGRAAGVGEGNLTLVTETIGCEKSAQAYFLTMGR